MAQANRVRLKGQNLVLSIFQHPYARNVTVPVYGYTVMHEQLEEANPSVLALMLGK